MTDRKIIKSTGQISRGLLVLAGIIIVATIITFIVIKIATKPPEPPTPPNGNGENGAYQPEYEAIIDDMRFIFQESQDRGDTLKGSDSTRPQYQEDLTTNEKFIEVTIGAQNIGKENIPRGRWDIGEVIDEEERRFEALTSGVRYWLPEDNQCGDLLKPGFSPTSCTKIYEVAAVSNELKIEVSFIEDRGISGEPKKAVIDLFVMPQGIK